MIWNGRRLAGEVVVGLAERGSDRPKRLERRPDIMDVMDERRKQQNPHREEPCEGPRRDRHPAARAAYARGSDCRKH
jgi:hypothetical protein